MRKPVLYIIATFIAGGQIGYGQDQGLRTGTVFKEFSFKKMISPFKAEYDHLDSMQAELMIDDLKDAVAADVVVNFWGGHIGTSDQTFKVNGSRKFDFPQPSTPGDPHCYMRCVPGNRPVSIPVSLLKKGLNVFHFFCGPQVCYSFNWPHYWLNSFTVRVYYKADSHQYASGKIVKDESTSIAHNHSRFHTEVTDSTLVESVEYIGYYKDYDLDADGKLEGWHYTLNNGEWDMIIGKQWTAPYNEQWDNYWLPEQTGIIKVIAKINSKNGLSYFTSPIEYTSLVQANSRVRMFQATNIPENFSSRVGRRKECKIIIDESLNGAVSAYLLVSAWCGAPEDGAIHVLGLNEKVVAESPGKLHTFELLSVPVPLDYLKEGENTFYVYSETEEHMFEINYPGPAILVRYAVSHPQDN